MKVLVVGSGGREHALVWKLAQSPKVTEIFCAPGNGGIADMAQCVPVAADDMEGLLAFAKDKAVDLTLVGPEVSLTLGIVDIFQEAGLRIFGPNKNAAALEGSKVFMKDLLAKYNIPSAQYASFTDRDQAMAYVEKIGVPPCCQG